MPFSQPPPVPAAGPASASGQRWRELLDGVVSLLPARATTVLVDGAVTSATGFAARLAAALATAGRPIRVGSSAREGCAREGCAREGCAPQGRALNGDAGPEPAREREDPRAWDVVIWLRTAAAGDPGDRPERRRREERADIVIDLHDQDWPVIRRVAARLAADGPWYLTETRAFFAYRAASWDTKFGDDLPAYTAAISAAAIARGGVVLDIGCGSGRALSPLRQAVGPAGSLFALDLTPEMLAVARPASIAARAALVLADARALPLAAASVDAIFAAGLVNHLPDTEAGLCELARVTRPGGLLVLFHPTGRAALAARHGRDLDPDEPLAEPMLRRFTAASGWRLTAYDDAAHRFYARAERC